MAALLCSGMCLAGFPGDDISRCFPLLWSQCSRCSASWSVLTRRTARRSSSCSTMACVGLVCWLRCTPRCVPLIVGLRRRHRWQYTASFAGDDAHHVSVQAFCRQWHSIQCPRFYKDVDIPAVVLDRCPVNRRAENCGAPQLQFVDQVGPSLFGNRDRYAQCNCAVCSWPGLLSRGQLRGSLWGHYAPLERHVS